MSGYDPEKDELVWSKFLKADKNTEIAITVHQYDGRDPKLGLAKRYFTRNGDAKFKKLGRLSKGEAEKLLNALPTAIEKL